MTRMMLASEQSRGSVHSSGPRPYFLFHVPRLLGAPDMTGYTAEMSSASFVAMSVGSVTCLRVIE